MERTTRYENDLTEERSSTPIEREKNQYDLALDPVDADEDDGEEDEEEEEEDDDEDLDD